jgi:hypothetical protein
MNIINEMMKFIIDVIKAVLLHNLILLRVTWSEKTLFGDKKQPSLKITAGQVFILSDTLSFPSSKPLLPSSHGKMAIPDNDVEKFKSIGVVPQGSTCNDVSMTASEDSARSF